jgi:formate dehydrogenase iron-sulfur subunit
MATPRTMELVRRSASNVPDTVEFKDEVVKLIDVSKCIGCKACQGACIEWNDRRQPVGINVGSYQEPSDLTPDMWTLMKFTEYENTETGNLEWLIRKDGCMHCADPGCLKACPAPGAIVQYSNGIVDFVEENCIGCGYCVKGCPFDIPRISERGKAHKCTLCSDRVAVGDGPACAKACPTHAIVFGTKDEMLDHAQGRIDDLKSRGFNEAGLYNPDGVSGTHVMYVLHHADKPEIYAGLPKDPTISPLVDLWKGPSKFVGLFAIVGAVGLGFLHYIVKGPNRPTREDEERARQLAEEDR